MAPQAPPPSPMGCRDRDSITNKGKSIISFGDNNGEVETYNVYILPRSYGKVWQYKVLTRLIFRTRCLNIAQAVSFGHEREFCCACPMSYKQNGAFY